MVKYILILLLVIILLILAITIGAQNNQVVTFSYLIAKSEYRLSTLLSWLFGGGFILGWLVSGIFYFRLRLKLLAANRKVKKLQMQLSNDKSSNSSTTLKS